MCNSKRNHVRLFNSLFLLAVFFTTCCFSQQKDITLEDIWGGTFRTERMDALHSMNNGQQYSVLNFDRESRSTSVDIYDYKTLKKVSTLVSSADLEGVPYFTDYKFSDDETMILLSTEEESIYRRSSLGISYVYDLQASKLTKIAEKKVQEPTFSPDGNKVAYGYQNNLYIKDLKSGDTKQITFDGETNKIINGITDWVYEEEFGFVRAFEWNANGSYLAYIRFDETEVPEFSMDIYGTALYPSEQTFKYPKAGEKNSLVSLHMYDVNADKTTPIEVSKPYSDFYIPRIKWTNNPEV